MNHMLPNNEPLYTVDTDLIRAAQSSIHPTIAAKFK